MAKESGDSMSWIGPLIGAIGGVGAAAMQDDDTSATTTSTNAPASWKSIGAGADDLWNEFIGTFSGSSGMPGGKDFGAIETALHEELKSSNPGRLSLLQETNSNISRRQAALNYLTKNGGPTSYIDDKTGKRVEITNDAAAYAYVPANMDPNDREGYVKFLTEDINKRALDKESAFPELKGMYSEGLWAGDTGTKGKTLKDMMAEDTASQKDASTKYLEDMGVITKDTTSGLDTLLGDYNTGLKGQMDRSTEASGGYSSALDKIAGDAKTPAFNLLMGKKSVPIQTNRQMKLAELLKDTEGDKYKGTREDIDFQTTGLGSLYDTGTKNLGAKFDLNSDQLGRELNVATEYTPNKSSLDYFDKLWPIIQSFQGNRFGSGTVTDTASVPTSFAEKLNTGINVGTKLNDLFKALNLGGKKEEDKTLDYLP